MGLVNAKEIYTKARQGNYGVGGFVAENMEMIRAILLAAEETKSPVIITLWEKDIEFATPGMLETIIKFYSKNTAVPVAIMLDHGTNMQSCLQAVQNGHTCVMIDASHENFDNNARITREVCRKVHPLGIMVEGEIGTIRRTFEDVGEYSSDSILTEPDVVNEFVLSSEIDAVAVSIGNESGIIDQVIDLDRLKRISDSTDAFIILHGGSCTSDDDIGKAVECGATGFRFASENRIMYLNAVEKHRKSLSENFADTRLIYGQSIQEVKELIKTRMKAMGCAGKAW